jgi:multicomponent Na+:H+ antiporter subunit F
MVEGLQVGWVIAAAAIGVLAAFAMLVARLLRGPTLYDRALAANAAGTKAVILFLLLGALAGRPVFVDIAIAYCAANFISTIAVLRFFRYRSFQAPLVDPRAAPRMPSEGAP